MWSTWAHSCFCSLLFLNTGSSSRQGWSNLECDYFQYGGADLFLVTVMLVHVSSKRNMPNDRYTCIHTHARTHTHTHTCAHTRIHTDRRSPVLTGPPLTSHRSCVPSLHSYRETKIGSRVKMWDLQVVFWLSMLELAHTTSNSKSYWKVGWHTTVMSRKLCLHYTTGSMTYIQWVTTLEMNVT